MLLYLKMRFSNRQSRHRGSKFPLGRSPPSSSQASTNVTAVEYLDSLPQALTALEILPLLPGFLLRASEGYLQRELASPLGLDKNQTSQGCRRKNPQDQAPTQHCPRKSRAGTSRQTTIAFTHPKHSTGVQQSPGFLQAPQKSLSHTKGKILSRPLLFFQL